MVNITIKRGIFMAFGFFLNMEALSLKIAQEHIALMTDDNIKDDVSLENDKLLNNIKNGFVVITQLSTFMESFFNTILNSCIGYEDETLLKCSIDEKIAIIFMHYNKTFDIIKSQNPWQIFRSTTKVRNEMIHFKKTYIGDGSDIPNFTIANTSVRDFFTKSNMENTLNKHIALSMLIATELGLKIASDVDIFSCDGCGDIVNYVYTPYKDDDE